MHLDRLALAAGALVVALSVKSNGQSTDARKGVEQVLQEYAAAMKAGDACKVRTLLTDNNVEVQDDGRRLGLSPAKPIDCKQFANLGGLQALFARTRQAAATWTISDFGSSGNLAWAAGTVAATWVDKTTGKDSGSGSSYFVGVYERQANGKYLERFHQETRLPPKNGAP